MNPHGWTIGDVFAGLILVALFLVMLGGIAVAMPLRKALGLR